MLDQVLQIFNIKTHYDLNLMKKNQTLADITGKCVSKLTHIIHEEQPDLVIVQGDTTSAFSGALSSFYNKIPVGHVEAGLRTNNMFSPWPEEGNRRLISVLSLMHFAPTKTAKENLVAEGINPNDIYITGNTVIDTLDMTVEKIIFNNKIKSGLSDWLSKICSSADEIINKRNKLILITGHRRENFGSKMENIFTAIRNLAIRYPQITFLFPVHLNPIVNEIVIPVLSNINNVILIKPVEYIQMVYLMMQAHLIITDSGGIQEEAPSLRTPVLVTRTESERPEGITAGCAKLVGYDRNKIESTFIDLIENESSYNNMLLNKNPYGDGNSASKILEIIINHFKVKK
jgi:UDP-N-acetylglucosamine 2-epimerase (non-hydrolysing)